MYTGKTFNRERIYICGDFMDGDIYPVFQPAGKRRSRCKPTSEIQKRLNQRNAERKLTRLVHANFGEEDIALHLTYRRGEEPETEEEARKILSNYIRRLKRAYSKQGKELKYISCTEYGKRGGRVHHHLIINAGLSRDETEKIWGHGYANSKRLQFDENGATGLARYMTKDRHFYKRWNQSRNLVTPQAATFDGRISMGDINDIAEEIEAGFGGGQFEKIYPDFELTEVSVYRNNINRGAYIHFEMRRKTRSRR